MARGLSVAVVALAVAVPVAAAPAVTHAGPTTCPALSYTVASGDYWTSIARSAKVSLTALLTANSATATTAIHPGSVLCLPTSAVAPVPPAAAAAPTTAAAAAAPTAAGSTVPAAAIPLDQFPVQGPCVYVDSYGAPRSGGRKHEGVDLVAKTGQYVYAVRDGTLTKQYVNASLTGNGWRLTVADGTYFFYAHLSAFAEGLSVGSKVKAGQIIGFVGMTGDAGLPHLHFEVHPKGGSSINPTPTAKAADACQISAVPAQPNGAVPGKATPPPPANASIGAPIATTPSVPPSSGIGSSAGQWKFINAVTALETGGKRMAPGAIRQVKVAGLANVPATTPGVLVRIQARNVATQGFVVVQPCDGSAVTTSTLNIAPGRANATMNMVKVINGLVCVMSNVATDLRIEVVGYAANGGVGVQAISPRRVLDTREGAGPLKAGGSKAITLSALGADASSRAVSVTVSIVAAAGNGTIAIGPCGGQSWFVPYGANATQAFSAVIRTSPNGLCVTSSATAHVVIDVNGVWAGSSSITPFGPQRLLDSRNSGAITPGGAQVSSAGLGASTAQLTVTVLGGATGAAVNVWNCADSKPVASVGAADAGAIVSVSATMKVSGGAICVSTTSTAHVVIDATAAG